MRFLKLFSIAVTAVTLLLGGCTVKEMPTDACVFDVSTDKVQATKARFFVIPSNPEAYYFVALVAVGEQDYGLPLDEVITGRLDEKKQLYEDHLRNNEPVTNFADMYLFRGTRYFFFKSLGDDTDYRLVFAQIDPDRRVPIGTPTEMRFHTKILELVEGQHFYASLEDNILTITPTVKGAPFAWDFVSKDVLDDDYLGNQDLYLYELMAMYESYNFTGYAACVGTEIWDLDKSVTPMKEGEVYVLVVAGYQDGEFTSKVYSVNFRYRKSGSEFI